MSRYTGVDYVWRVFASSAILMGITAGLTYPFDLVHTRLTSDMSSKTDKRLFATTFDCFNRTNIDEGFRAGVCKGVEISIVASALRTGLALPIYSVLQSNQIQKSASSNSYTGNFYKKMGVSFMSSMVLSLVLYPLDTAKRAMQLSGSRGYHHHFKSSTECMMTISTKFGFKALYSGVPLFFVKELLTAFTQLTIYDAVFASSLRVNRSGEQP